MSTRPRQDAPADGPPGVRDASPYQDLPDEAFWRSAVAEASPAGLRGLYKKKWSIPADARIATAGSCFAQHVTRHLRQNGMHVLDVEPPPETLPQALHKKFGYVTYSARYGNIYTTLQLLQLAEEAVGLFSPQAGVWRKAERFYDALRPGVEPEGLGSFEEVLAQRKSHLAQVRRMLETMDVFIFTLGLTEAWIQKASGTVYPTAPGTIAGSFDAAQFAFVNFGFREVLDAFESFRQLVGSLRPEGSRPKILLSVSPVPLTATASGKHVLQATAYSKSVLRAVAGQLADEYDDIDYFPSFEIITNQAARGQFYEDNLRSVTADGVKAVMAVFFGEHAAVPLSTTAPNARTQAPAAAGRVRRRPRPVDNDTQCEEALLEVFAHGGYRVGSDPSRPVIRFVGDSHIASLRTCIARNAHLIDPHYDYDFVPVRWMTAKFSKPETHAYFRDITIVPHDERLEAHVQLQPAERLKGGILCFVGCRLFGDGLYRAHRRPGGAGGGGRQLQADGTEVAAAAGCGRPAAGRQYSVELR